MNKSKFLIIGSNSFSGSSFISYLLKKKFKVIGISRSKELNKVLLEMTNYSIGCCFFVTKDNHLIGVLTDGDIRRLLLKKIDLNEKIYKYCKKSFNYISEKLLKSARARL